MEHGSVDVRHIFSRNANAVPARVYLPLDDERLYVPPMYSFCFAHDVNTGLGAGGSPSTSTGVLLKVREGDGVEAASGDAVTREDTYGTRHGGATMGVGRAVGVAGSEAEETGGARANITAEPPHGAAAEGPDRSFHFPIIGLDAIA